MALADHLRAAKALIDTPEKLAGRSLVAALDDALGREPLGSGADARLVGVLRALSAADNGSIRADEAASHAAVLALLDRAISTAETSNGQ